MQPKQNKRENIKYIALAVLILSGFLVKFFSDRIQKERDLVTLQSTFKGIIVKKEKMRETLITYRLVNSTKQDDFMSSPDLADHAAIGDTIFKLPNSNYCLLSNHHKKLKVKCFSLNQE